MRMIDWSSAVCSSDLRPSSDEAIFTAEKDPKRLAPGARRCGSFRTDSLRIWATAGRRRTRTSMSFKHRRLFPAVARSEEHTSELQSLMLISYAVYCYKHKIIVTYIVLLT